MKKIFTLLFALVATTALWAVDFEVDGIYYNILKYKINEVEVTYQYEFSSDNYSHLTAAVIPETVTFNGTTYSVTSIGDFAFYTCTGLTSITIPNSVTSIGRSAFCGCSSLTYLSIPNSVVYKQADGLQFYNIYECYNLKTLIVPASFFGVIEDDYQITIEKLLPYMPEKLDTLVLNDEELPRFGWDFIGRNRKTLKTIDMAATTNTSIAEEAFKNFYNLENLALPSQLEYIPYMSIAECMKLQAITIPATVTEIADRAFEDCRSLKSIIFEGEETPQGAPHRAAAEGSALWRIGSWAFYNCHQLEHLTIPEGVTEVGDAAFYGCAYLEDMTLPSTVQEIGDNGFALCAKLQKIHVKATTPPTIKAKTFFDVNRQIPVYVPDEVVAAYESDPYWSEFDIQGESKAPAGVDEIQISTTNVQKLIRDGQLLIIREGKTYNAQGAAL